MKLRCLVVEEWSKRNITTLCQRNEINNKEHTKEVKVSNSRARFTPISTGTETEENIQLDEKFFYFKFQVINQISQL